MKRKSKNIITFDCYDRKTNTCNGSCQGCSSCPMVTKHQISRKEMWKYMKQEYIRNKKWRRFEQHLKDDWEFQQKMKSLLKKIK